MGSIGVNRGSVGVSNSINNAIERQTEAFSTEQTYQLNGQSAPSDIRSIETTLGGFGSTTENNPRVNFRDTTYIIQNVENWQIDRGSYTVGHLYVPLDADNRGSFFVSENGTLWSSPTAYLQSFRRRVR